MRKERIEKLVITGMMDGKRTERRRKDEIRG